MELKKALETIKNECNKHEFCKDCPLNDVNDIFGYNYCSITGEGDVPGEWNIEEMIR